MKKQLLLCLALAGPLAATQADPLQNGNFETGDFTGWNGELIMTGPVDPDTDTHFTIVPNAGPSNSQIANITNDDTDWLATLYQDFDLDSLAPGETMDIRFWIQWTPTDSDNDGVSAELSDAGYTDTVDLLDGIADSDLLSGTWVTRNITSFAQTWGGQSVELAFTLADYDYVAQDTLSIDAITIERHATVPEPSGLLLLAGGLAGLLYRKRASTQSKPMQEKGGRS